VLPTPYLQSRPTRARRRTGGAKRRQRKASGARQPRRGRRRTAREQNQRAEGRAANEASGISERGATPTQERE